MVECSGASQLDEFVALVEDAWPAFEVVRNAMRDQTPHDQFDSAQRSLVSYFKAFRHTQGMGTMRSLAADRAIELVTMCVSAGNEHESPIMIGRELFIAALDFISAHRKFEALKEATCPKTLH